MCFNRLEAEKIRFELSRLSHHEFLVYLSETKPRSLLDWEKQLLRCGSKINILARAILHLSSVPNLGQRSTQRIGFDDRAL